MIQQHGKIAVILYFLFHSAGGFVIHQKGVTKSHIDSSNRFSAPTLYSSPVTPEFDEICDTTGVTLTRFMHEVERVNPELQELAQLFSGIQTASKAITNLVKRSQLPSSSLLGLEGAINVQGEDQKVCSVNLPSIRL